MQPNKSEGFAAHSAKKVNDDCVDQMVRIEKELAEIRERRKSNIEHQVKKLMQRKRLFGKMTREKALAQIASDRFWEGLSKDDIRESWLEKKLAELSRINLNAVIMLDNNEEQRADIFLTHSEANLVFGDVKK